MIISVQIRLLVVSVSGENGCNFISHVKLVLQI